MKKVLSDKIKSQIEQEKKNSLIEWQRFRKRAKYRYNPEYQAASNAKWILRQKKKFAQGKIEFVKDQNFVNWHRRYGFDLAKEMATYCFKSVKDYQEAIINGDFKSSVVKGDVFKFFDKRRKKMAERQIGIVDLATQERRKKQKIYRENNPIKAGWKKDYQKSKTQMPKADNPYYRFTTFYSVISGNYNIDEKDLDLRQKVILIGMYAINDWRIMKREFMKFLNADCNRADNLDILFHVIPKDEMRRLYFFAMHEAAGKIEGTFFRELECKISKFATAGQFLDLAEYLVDLKTAKPELDFSFIDRFIIFGQKTLKAKDFIMLCRKEKRDQWGSLNLEIEKRADMIAVKSIGGVRNWNDLRSSAL